MTATICLKTPAYGRGRVAFGDRQMVAVTFLRARLKWDPYEPGGPGADRGHSAAQAGTSRKRVIAAIAPPSGRSTVVTKIGP